jgi:hypothetical protein
MWYSTIDWLKLWKLHHYQFFWLYLLIGVPLRLLTAQQLFQHAQRARVTVSMFIASIGSALSSTWFPIVPILTLCPLYIAGAHWVSDSLVISTALTSLTIAVQTAAIDKLTFQVLLKRSVNREFVWVLASNLLNSSVALVAVIAWQYYYGPEIIAVACVPTLQ